MLLNSMLHCLPKIALQRKYLLLAPTAYNQNPVTTPDTTCNGRNSPSGTSGEIKIYLKFKF